MQIRTPHILNPDIEDLAEKDVLRLRLVRAYAKSPRRDTPRPRLQRQPGSVPVDELPLLLEEWVNWSRRRGNSPRTATLRRQLMGSLIWHLRQQGATVCGTAELNGFFDCLATGHEDAGGRWGRGQVNRGGRALSPATLETYYRHLAAFFTFLIDQDMLQESPMWRVARPESKPDQVDPFSPEQIVAMIREARRSRYPRRNEAIIRLLLDTGLRASELCGIKLGDVDLFEGRARVTGKGNKSRTVRWGDDAGKALRAYLGEEYYSSHDSRDPAAPLFLSEGGPASGRGLSRVGLRLLITKLGKRAGITHSRCSPHTFRHTFAIMFLRRGGHLAALQEILGHESLKVTLRYTKFAAADIDLQQRQFSPGDALRVG